jgi:hypothetical protein
MYLFVLIAAVIFMLSGMVLRLLSFREKEPKASSFLSLNPRLWFTPIWKRRDWFTPSGYRKYVLGCSLITSGALMYLVTMLLR